MATPECRLYLITPPAIADISAFASRLREALAAGDVGALQHAPQTTWKGKSENVAAAQRAFAHRAQMNGLAALGQWKSDMEKQKAA